MNTITVKNFDLPVGKMFRLIQPSFHPLHGSWQGGKDVWKYSQLCTHWGQSNSVCSHCLKTIRVKL